MTDFTSRSEVDNAVAALRVDTRCIVGGMGRIKAHGETFEAGHPDAGRTTGSYVDAVGLVRMAVDAARSAYERGDWRRQTFAQRAAIFTRWALLLDERARDIALLDALEMGMPISEALADVAVTTAGLRDIGVLAQTLTNEAGVTRPGMLQVNIRAPLGVIAAITPWNFPFNQAVVKIAPALMMGNSVVLKPSELSSGSALLLGELALEAGLPAGVLNVITGRGATTGSALVSARGIDKVTFTGSARTGAAIQKDAAANGYPVPLTMELGGKSPHIVCETFSEIEAIAPVLAHGVFWNGGQVCSAGTRLIVHESIADALIEAVARASDAFMPGDPLDPETTTGPIARARQYDSVTSHMSQAEREGARTVRGGTPAANGAQGLRIAPTIYDHVSPDADICHEEVFGPVLAVSRFNTREEAIHLANSSGYGLSATAWTRDLAEGHALANALSAAVVTINAHSGPPSDASSVLGFEPAGRSGFGADFGRPGLLEYTQLKLASFNTG